MNVTKKINWLLLDVGKFSYSNWVVDDWNALSEEIIQGNWQVLKQRLIIIWNSAGICVSFPRASFPFIVEFILFYIQVQICTVLRGTIKKFYNVPMKQHWTTNHTMLFFNIVSL